MYLGTIKRYLNNAHWYTAESVSFWGNPSAMAIALCAKTATINNPVPQLGVRLLDVIVDNNLLVGARKLGELQFILCLRQSLGQRVLGLGTSATKTLLQFFQRRRGKEQEARIQIGLLDLLHTLHFDIKDTDALLLGNVLDGLHGSSVVVSTELSMLDKAIGGNKVEESLLGDEVIFTAVLFAGARLTGCVCLLKYGFLW